MYLHPDVQDNGLIELLEATALHLVSGSSDPADRAAVISASLAVKTTPTINTPAAGSPDGRQVTIPRSTDGTVTSSGTATRWALIDGTRLLACNTLQSSVEVTAGRLVDIGSITIRFPMS